MSVTKNYMGPMCWAINTVQIHKIFTCGFPSSFFLSNNVPFGIASPLAYTASWATRIRLPCLEQVTMSLATFHPTFISHPTAPCDFNAQALFASPVNAGR